MAVVTFGMLPDGDLPDSLKRVLRLCGKDWLAIIRSIDSSRPPKHLAKVFAFCGVPHNVINGNFCLTIDTLRQALDGVWRGGLFSGFDEVWIIKGNPPDIDLATLPYATSDGADFSSGMPDPLAAAMEQTTCILILGDGCGLNYATTDPQIAKAISDEG